jgi:hypothetical protein
MSIDKVRGTDTLTLRLTKEDKAALDELVEAERVELAARGVAVSIAQYVRGLIRTAHAALVAKRQATPPATVPAAAAAPAPTPPAKTTKAAPTEAEVRRKLKASKLTQAELARATSIDAAMLSRFRSGKKSLSPEKLARLSDAIG